MNELAAERLLVLDELEADLILTQQVQGVLNLEADAFEQLVARSVNSLITRQRRASLFLPPRMTQFFSKPGQVESHALVLKTLLGAVPRSFVERKREKYLKTLPSSPRVSSHVSISCISR